MSTVTISDFTPDELAGNIPGGDARALDSLVEDHAEPADPAVARTNTLQLPTATDSARGNLVTLTHTISAGTVPAGRWLPFTLLPRDNNRRTIVVRVLASAALTSGVIIGGDLARVQNKAGGFLMAYNDPPLILQDFTGPLFCAVGAEAVDVNISVASVTEW